MRKKNYNQSSPENVSYAPHSFSTKQLLEKLKPNSKWLPYVEFTEALLCFFVPLHAYCMIVSININLHRVQKDAKRMSH